MRAPWLAALVLLTGFHASRAQLPSWVPELRGYFLNVPLATASGPFNDAAAVDFQRLRLMMRPTDGDFTFNGAYEQLITLRSDSGAGSVAGLAPLGSGSDWLPLQGTISETEHLLWRHRVDRLSARYSSAAVDATIGRQPISWATTLFLTPADPFVPFDPSDPFREYRAGVDAARLRIFTGPFTEFDGVVRVAESSLGATVTALGRARTSLGGWELAGWGGVLHEEAAFSGAATLSIGGAVLRGEAVIRRTEDATVLRATIGADRSFDIGGRNVYLIAEYQRDGFGAASPQELLDVLRSNPARRGELQVLGRDEVFVQGSIELHPLFTADALVLWNLNDPSALIAPGGSYSAGNEVLVRGGVYVGVGAGATTEGLPGSEYGIVPTTAYASVTWFF
jgi:hypothetical protein